MKAIDIIIMALVGGLLALPIYMVAFQHSHMEANALEAIWALDALACFVVLCIEVVRKG